MLLLKVLEKMLPWLSEEELKYMLRNLKQGGLTDDEAFVNSLIGWANEWKVEYPRQDGITDCPFPCNSDDRRSVKRRFTCRWDIRAAHERHSIRSGESQQIFATRSPNYKRDSTNAVAESLSMQSCCSSSSFSSTYPEYCLFGMDSTANSKKKAASPKPIDCIFQFHKAIQKDLEFLDKESVRVTDCDNQFLRQFTGRFTLLWGLYRAHSNAEDQIVFPALEGKETLHNISHSYVIDHEQEEQLFKDISDVLTQLSDLHAKSPTEAQEGPQDSEIYEHYSYSGECKEILKHKLDLSAKLQGMCKSMHISLNQHISREERELWPLLNTHFSVREQEKIVERVIGTTGAEVLKSMIPWVTAALSLEEQSSMFDTWLLATRNTMFDQWLHACFPSSPIWSPPPVKEQTESSTSQQQDDMPQPGKTECLRMVAEYLAKDTCSVSAESIAEDVECMMETEELSSDVCFEDEKKTNYSSDFSAIQRTESTDHEYSCLPDKRAFQSRDEKGSANFKAGWQDIFRMNQKELELAVRKVSNDESLDPRQKAYLMQNLMTSRWIVAQQRQPIRCADDKEVPGSNPSFHDHEKKIFGCEHYKRNCKLLAACCGLLFTCRFCHDNVSDHTMDRQATKEMMCMKCLKIQPVGQHCSTPSCNNFSIAKYYCNICKFFDDDNKDIYHCPYCNLCRVGKGLGIDFFHCMICNACMNVSLKNHKCREKGLESNCPICHDFMFTSKAPVKALSCGHFMHSACFQAFINHHYTCPICCKSVGDMSVYFGMLDGLLASEELPEELKNRKQDILCNDCEQRGTAPFHWLYHKCAKCGSYNTRVL